MQRMTGITDEKAKYCYPLTEMHEIKDLKLTGITAIPVLSEIWKIICSTLAK
jgi:hypothetical protein